MNLTFKINKNQALFINVNNENFAISGAILNENRTTYSHLGQCVHLFDDFPVCAFYEKYRGTYITTQELLNDIDRLKMFYQYLETCEYEPSFARIKKLLNEEKG